MITCPSGKPRIISLRYRKLISSFKRRSLLRRKAMTILDSVLKSRDITLPTEVHLVKVVVFPVVMYGYESHI